MGLLDKIKNIAKRVFTPKKYREEQEAKEAERVEKELEKTLKETREEDQKREQKTEETNKKEKTNKKKTGKEETKTEETKITGIPEEDLTEEGQKKKEEEKEIIIDGEKINKEKSVNEAKGRLKELYKGKNTYTEEEANKKVNEAIRSTGEEISFGNLTDALSYKEMMKNAILSNTIKVDESIAELISENAERFKARFTTNVELFLSGGKGIEVPDIAIIFQGSLPHEICELAKDEFREGEIADASTFLKKVADFAERMQEEGKSMGVQVRTNRLLNKTESIVKIGYKVRFR